MGTLNNFKSKIIKNFLSKEELKLIKEYCVMKHRTNFFYFDDIQSVNRDTGFYADTLMESLLINKKHIIEREINLELLPTYSYWRVYSMFANLEKHKDRPPCEISATIMIDADKSNWPLKIEGVSYNLNPGEALIYSGTESWHERDEYEGDYHIQTFLHYVNKNGPYKDHFRDKRQLFGVQKGYINGDKTV